MPTFTFEITFSVDRKVSVVEAAEYINTALLAECGHRDPNNDPMADFDRDSLGIVAKGMKKS